MIMQKIEKNFKYYTYFTVGIMFAVLLLYLIYWSFSVVSLILLLAQCALVILYSRKKQLPSEKTLKYMYALSIVAFLYAVFNMSKHILVSITSLYGAFLIFYLLRLPSLATKERGRWEDKFFGKDKDILGFHTEEYRNAYDEYWNKAYLCGMYLSIFGTPMAVIALLFFNDIGAWLNGIITIFMLFSTYIVYLVYTRKTYKKIFYPIWKKEKEEQEKQIYQENNYGKWKH